MLRYFLFITYCIFSHSLFSQTNSECEKLIKLADSLYYSNPDSSYLVSKESEKCALKSQDQKLIAQSAIYIGRYLLLKSDLEEASIKFNEAASIYTNLGDWSGMGSVLKLKSNLQSRIGNEPESLRLLNEAVLMYKKGHNSKGMNSSLLNLSYRYIQQKNFTKAENILNEIELQLDSLSKSNHYFFHQNKGILYLETNRLDEAFVQLSLAHLKAIEGKMLDSEATILKYMGSYYRLDKQYSESKQHLDKSISIATINHLDHELSETYEELILLYKDMGNYTEAYNTLVLQTKLKNKLVNIEKINTISLLEKKLAVSEKEKEIEKEKLNSQKVKTRNQLLTYILIAVGIFCLFIVYLFFKTRTLKNEISIQNDKLEEKNNIIEEKSRGIMDSIHYAKRIQKSLLPTDIYIDKSLNRLKNNKKN